MSTSPHQSPRNTLTIYLNNKKVSDNTLAAVEHPHIDAPPIKHLAMLGHSLQIDASTFCLHSNS